MVGDGVGVAAAGVEMGVVAVVVDGVAVGLRAEEAARESEGPVLSVGLLDDSGIGETRDKDAAAEDTRARDEVSV